MCEGVAAPQKVNGRQASENVSWDLCENGGDLGLLHGWLARKGDKRSLFDKRDEGSRRRRALGV